MRWNHRPCPSRSQLLRCDSVLRARLWSLVAALLLAGSGNALMMAQETRQDEVILHAGNTLEGSVTERPTEKGNELQVMAEGGWTLILDRETYKRWKPEAEALSRYRELLPQIKWTLEDQLKMAQWCDQQRLKELAEHHFRIALEIDPDNPVARDELGFHRGKNGEWLNYEELVHRLGYQSSPGGWELPEVKQLREAQEKRKEIEVEWSRKLRILVGKAFRRGRQQAEAMQELLAISDPQATNEVVELLHDAQETIAESNNNTAQSEAFNKQQVALRILCNIDNTISSKALVHFYLLNTNDPESRDLVLETLLKRKHYQTMLMADFDAALNPRFEVDGKQVTDPDLNTMRMGRAAYGLEQIGVPYAIESLIRALNVSYTKVTNQQANSSFGGNGSTSVNPAGTKRVNTEYRNCPEALDALRKFTNLDPGFNYDRMAWMRWWIQENTPQSLDLRRD